MYYSTLISLRRAQILWGSHLGLRGALSPARCPLERPKRPLQAKGLPHCEGCQGLIRTKLV